MKIDKFLQLGKVRKDLKYVQMHHHGEQKDCAHKLVMTID